MRSKIQRLAVLALCYGAFELGRASVGYFIVSSMLERLDLQKRNQVLGDETEKLRHRVTVAEDPLSCVALGTGKVLDELDLLRKVATPA